MAQQFGDTAAHAAQGKVGRPYVWGTQGPNTFDCSGLICWAYAQAGKTITCGSKAQSQLGTAVSTSNFSTANLRPGDILCYDWFGEGDIGHVALYIGDGQVVEAFNEDRGVILSNAFSGGHRNAYRFTRRPFAYQEQVSTEDALVRAIIAALLAALNLPDTNTRRVIDNTNLRSGPGTNYAVIGVLTGGTNVNLRNHTPTSANGFEWYNVHSSQFGSGWMVNNFEPV